MSQTDKTNDNENKPNTWHYVGYAVGALLLVLTFAYVSWSWTYPSESTDELKAKMLDLRGKLGDSFGPVNALLSSLGFIALLYSINLQRALAADQARIQRESIDKQQKAATELERMQRRQRFEELFALTVSANRSALADVRVQTWNNTRRAPVNSNERTAFGDYGVPESTSGPNLMGKQALREIWSADFVEQALREISDLIDSPLANELKEFRDGGRYADENVDASSRDTGVATLRLVFDQTTDDDRDRILSVMKRTYKELYRWHEYHLDSYFRTLYRVFELLSRAPIDYELSKNQTREYAAIARAQLSWYELALVLLNCTADHWPNAGVRYNRFALFDNLSLRSDPLVTLLHRYVVKQQEGVSSARQVLMFSGLTAAAFDTDKSREDFGEALTDDQ